jgi:hypothetical protein
MREREAAFPTSKRPQQIHVTFSGSGDHAGDGGELMVPNINMEDKDPRMPLALSNVYRQHVTRNQQVVCPNHGNKLVC